MIYIETLTKFCKLQPNFTCLFFVFLTVGSALSVPSVADRCMPATGCDGPGAACTTWPVLPVSPVRGSCRQGRSSAWWRAGCSAAATMTSWWTTSAELQKTVTALMMVCDGLQAEICKSQGHGWIDLLRVPLYPHCTCQFYYFLKNPKIN